jgi:DNA-3-methyladenine glycosylase
MTVIKPDFFTRPTLTVARALLGQRLVRYVDGQRLGGMIVETEAYIGSGDSASHASKGRTPRTDVMYGPPGHAYVYLIYGMYHMLNLTTEQEGFPAAVLLRAIEPQEGISAMQVRRQGTNRSPLQPKQLTNGPGKLCQALDVDKTLHNWDVTLGQELWLEYGQVIFEANVATGPRIGIDYAAPEDKAAPWRFWIQGNRFVSKR